MSELKNIPLLQYPYYDKHSYIVFDYFNRNWDDSFDMFFMMAMNFSPDGGRTYSFLLQCQNLQQKAKEHALTEEEVNHFKDSLDNFFTYTDEGPPRKYLQPSYKNAYETTLWQFAKAAVALYKHCQEIIAKGKLQKKIAANHDVREDVQMRNQYFV